MTIRDFISALSGGQFDEKLYELYGESGNEMLRNRIRYISACENFSKNYPHCNNIRVYSLPAKIKIGSVPLFLTADKIMVKGDGMNVSHVLNEIPKGLETAELNETTGIPDCFSGYSLCIAKFGTSRSRKEIPQIESSDFYSDIAEHNNKYTEREMYRIAVDFDEKKRNHLEYDAVMSGDLSEFFRLINGSSMHTLCTSKVQVAVLFMRDFMDSDSAVMAENNMVKAFVPSYLAEDYAEKINSVFGKSRCSVMKIRSTGGFEFKL